jgi:hypothetical protein
MPHVGFDYSWGQPTPAQLRAAGAQFVCRYLSNDPGKNLTAAETRSLIGAGIAVVCNWESTATRANDGGFAGGAQDATSAQAQARACGIPDDRPIYFSVDQDTTVGPKITAYFQGIASIIPRSRIGVYGSYQVVKGCLDAGLVSWAWQTYAWSGGRWDSRAHIRQVQNGLRIGSADVDRNEAQATDFGQFPPPSRNTPNATGGLQVSDFPTIGGRDPNSAPWKTAQTHPDNVQVARALLQLAGAFAAPRAGGWDDKDAGATEWFQRSMGLTVDAIIGDATWAKLCHVRAS